LTIGKLLAAGTAITGCALMVLGQPGGIGNTSLLGVAFAIVSALTFAFYTAYGQRGLQRHAAPTVLAYAFLSAAIAWQVIRPPWTLPWTSYDLQIWGFILYLSTVVTVLPFGLYLASLRHLEASRSNLTSMLEPVVATTLAWLWLGEQMQPMQIAGGAAVLGGVLLLQIESAMFIRRITERMPRTD
jgi:drug/metabolite transporter (DMT)-like permease